MSFFHLNESLFTQIYKDTFARFDLSNTFFFIILTPNNTIHFYCKIEQY
jgi:hypothetical protein